MTVTKVCRAFANVRDRSLEKTTLGDCVMNDFGELYQKLEANNALVLFNKSPSRFNLLFNLFQSDQNNVSTPITESELYKLVCEKKNEEFKDLSASMRFPYSNYTDA